MTKHTITIRFSTDKNGKRRAHYWGLAKRWLPISIAAAELKLANGVITPNAAVAIDDRSCAIDVKVDA